MSIATEMRSRVAKMRDVTCNMQWDLLDLMDQAADELDELNATLWHTKAKLNKKELELGLAYVELDRLTKQKEVLMD